MSENQEDYREPDPETGNLDVPSSSGLSKWLILGIGSFALLVVGVAAFFILGRNRTEVASDPIAPFVAEPVEAAVESPAKIETADIEASPIAGSDGGALANINRIAFIDPDGRLGTVAPDGSGHRLLTKLERFFQFPAWSPMGDSIAVIGGDFNESGVFVLADRADTEIRQLYNNFEQAPIYLYWSPEGKQVSFIARHREGLALHLAPKTGIGGTKILATSPGSFFWDWLPEGDEVLIHTGFTANQDNTSRTAFIPVSAEGEITEVMEKGFFQAPAVSADGRYYALGDVGPAGRHWLKVWKMGDNQPSRAIPHVGALAMGWSPAKAHLAYISPEVSTPSYFGPLQLLVPETGELRPLEPRIVVAFFWSPDGRYIAYLTRSDTRVPKDDNLDPDPNRQEALLPPGRDTSPLARVNLRTKSLRQQDQRLLLDLWIVEVDSGEKRKLTTFEPTDIFVSQFLPFFDQYALSHRIWAPDSKALVLPIVEDDEDQIIVIPLDGGQRQTIAEGVVAFWSQR